ncbi:MAG: FAD/NAD(P)-binding protein [Candidatus Omnitrophota bacterium]|nr:FAD/NAD(P)-binding protein [Candidatus Omnitrophota bacterium]
MTNPYAYIDAEVLDIVDETPNIKTFTLRPESGIGFRAGQFMDVTVPGVGEAPFTPSSNHNTKDRLDFTIMSAGRVTKILHNMEKGGIVGVRGPYGTAYPLDLFKSKEVLIVGGGVGLAPLRALLYALFNNVGDYKKIIVKYGSKTPKDIIYKKEIDSWKARAAHIDIEMTVDVGDDTWKGSVGIVTTILRDLNLDMNNAVSIVCGPPIMMKFATFKLLDLGFADKDIYLSMEKNMSCGVGKCGHCRIGPYYACKDGPVFTYDKIKELPNIWE